MTATSAPYNDVKNFKNSCHFYAKNLETDSEIFRFELRDEKEYQKVLELCADRTNMSGALKALIMPIRTDLSSLPKDLFLPTFINGALKIDDLSNRIFASFLCIALDILTLPLRFITVIPRAIYHANTNAKPHPIIAYLEKLGVPENLCKGYLQLTPAKKSEKYMGILTHRVQIHEREHPVFSVEAAKNYTIFHRKTGRLDLKLGFASAPSSYLL